MSTLLPECSISPLACYRARWALTAGSLCLLGAVADVQAETSDARPVEEVIVTAQKRAERLQDVPISISVMSGDVLDRSRVEGITEALTRVPGVATTVGYLGGATQLAVRGVTAGAQLTSGSSPIAYYLDSVPFGFVRTALGPDTSAYDLERVEVLRGPQGTLYGASAQNGVVRVLTKDANPDRFEFKGRTSISTTKYGGENYRGDMALNVPLVDDKLAVRAVAGYEDLSGWVDKPIRKDVNDAELVNLRLKVNARPTENLSIGLSASRSRADYGAPPISLDNNQRPSTLEEPIESNYDAYGLKIGYDAPSVALTSSTSYLDFSNDSFLDYGALGLVNTLLNTRVDSRVLAQEFYAQSTGEDAWRWTLGGMYRDVEDRLYQFRRQYVAPNDFTDRSKSFAVFGELTRVFLDGRVELTGGVRYFEDEVDTYENVSFVPGSPLYRAKAEFDKVSPRVILSWHPVKDLTFYGSYAEGFRSGFSQGANVFRSAPQFQPLKADNLKNYELGAKGSIAGGLFSYDAAVFYIDWQDVQQTLTVNAGSTAQPINVTAQINGESASGVGAEFALLTKPIEGLEFGINFSWNDLGMDTNTFSGGVLLFNEGDRLNLSPEYTAGASLDYSFPLGGSGLGGRFSAGANYTSMQDTRTIIGGALSVGSGDDIVISRAGFGIEGGERWSVTLYGDNLNNERGTPVSPPFRIQQWNSHVRPRTVGAQLEYRF